jgi:predicted DCC family thiol-disulfide oxidoreductase YuxK
MIRIGRRLGGAGHIMRVLSILPRVLQDWVYRRIARNRYTVLGRTKMCALPDPELRSRLIE